MAARNVVPFPDPPHEAERCVAHALSVPLRAVNLKGDLDIPGDARGLVIFAHGSGSSRLSPRNQFVARALRDAGSATFLFDLLTESEEAEDAHTGHLRFDIPFLTRRLVEVTKWVSATPAARDLPLGYFGASTGGAAALAAAAALGSQIRAVVSRGGRPDLAAEALPRVSASTLLIVGGEDHACLKLNKRAYALLHCEKAFAVVPGATHLFEEPGALEDVCKLAAEWFGGAWKGTRSGVPPRAGHEL